VTVHRGLGFELPPPIARLHAFLAANRARSWIVEHALRTARLAGWVGAPASSAESRKPRVPELDYTGHPFEVVPFAWQGGDGLQYAMLVHAPELAPRCSVVSYAPVDADGPSWLGDDARQGLANLMGVALREARSEYSSPDDRERRAEILDGIRTLGRALHIAPSKNVKGFTRGARSNRTATPQIPRSWRWVPAARGMGALAPAGLFDPALGAHRLPKWSDAGAELERARAALKRGFPASALAIARNVYADSFDEDTLAAAGVMREAYEALGRPFLVARVDAYLAVQAAEIEKREAAKRGRKKKRS
jgi:hypothetical protein